MQYFYAKLHFFEDKTRKKLRRRDIKQQRRKALNSTSLYLCVSATL